MLPHLTTRIVPGLQSWGKKGEPTLKFPIKYSEKDYETKNFQSIAFSCAQERLAARLIDESHILISDVKDTTSEWQSEVNRLINERLVEVRFLNEELMKQRNTGNIEDESLRSYINRIDNALAYIDRAMKINRQCLILREGRLGIDLCVDEIERQLLLELKTIEGGRELLEGIKSEALEQLRKFRETMYQLNEDIRQKTMALQIDEKNLKLSESLSTLEEGKDLLESFCDQSLDEWQRMSADRIAQNSKEINNTSSLRAYIDLVLTQVYEDLRNQTDQTNFVFKRRIEDAKKLKRLLEERHSCCGSNIKEITQNIRDLENQISDRQRSLLLCQTRLSNRARRPDQEKTCDLGQKALYSEHEALQISLCKLKQKMEENKAILRFQLHTNIMQEEEINIKTNTLHIDEVECMSLRQTLDFKQF